MPRGDGTGPDGRGPMTGRGLGPCGSQTKADPTRRTIIRKGLGRGPGGGRPR